MLSYYSQATWVTSKKKKKNTDLKDNSKHDVSYAAVM